MPSRARQLVEELTRQRQGYIQRYQQVAESLGLKAWEIKASSRWLRMQPIGRCRQTAERAESIVDGLSLEQLRTLVEDLTHD